MQFKASFVALALASLAAATPLNSARNTTPPTIPASQCNTGPVQCCQSTQSSDSSAVTAILALLGVAAPNVAVLAALTCDPITVIGVSGTSCNAQPVCCTNNSFKGLVALGCTPVNLNL